MAKMKYGAKKDANHKEIVDALTAMGANVLDLSSLGCGVPDILVWTVRGWILADIKNPNTAYGKKGLNKRQREWAAAWKGGPVYIIRTVDEAKLLVEGKLESLGSSEQQEVA